ncbi:MAG: helicase-related protein [Myxococcota bacterium]
MTLPIDALRGAFLEQAQAGPVVLSAPTGSGKSTQAPRWLRALGPVLVVEPRRVACRALAARVSSLEDRPLGDRVGYAVRDDRKASSQTEILFVTPGVALRMLRSDDAGRFQTLVLDEFHERTLDLDLLFALIHQRGRPRLVVMSATLEGDRIAEHLGGVHLSGEGRLFPVDTRYVSGKTELPDVHGLESRVQAALDRAAKDPGDVLVFLPGKGEIASVAARIRGDFAVLALHGGLTLAQQSRIFEPGEKRRVILSTNVAETSLTVPRIGVVIDSGLVRRTQYHHGRGYLTMMPIAQDSADQRAGRAGRLGPGVCYRLWSARAPLDAVTPPEIHRESLTPLLLAAAACGARPDELPFFDPPKPYALDDARAQLRLLDALDEDGAITERGEALFGLPMDAHLGRLLVEGEARGTLAMVIPLVAGLSIPRRLFIGRPQEPELDLRDRGCDAVAIIKAVTEGRPKDHLLDRVAVKDARHVASRLRALFPVPAPVPRIDRKALAMTILGAWPDAAHVARRRKRRVAWSNGGTELSLGRDSAINADKVEVALLLESRAFGAGHRKRALKMTAGMPVPIPWLVEAGLGRMRFDQVLYRRGEILARTERVYAGRVIETIEAPPQGAFARQAIRDLILEGRIFGAANERLVEGHAVAALAAQLNDQPRWPPLDVWLLARLEEVGVSSTEDLDLLEAEDILPEQPDEMTQHQIARRYPQTLTIGDARYRIRYDVSRQVATLHQVSGLRKTPPPERTLPRLPGWTIKLFHKNRTTTLRTR